MGDQIVSDAVGKLTDAGIKLIRDEVELLMGVEQEASNLSEEQKKIRNVLEDAERKEFKEKTVKDWLKRLEETRSEMEDVLDEWDYNLRKQEVEQSPKLKVFPFIPSPSPCLCFNKLFSRHRIGNKIQRVKAELDRTLGEKDRHGFSITRQPTKTFGRSWRGQSTSVEVDRVLGREKDRDYLKAKLMPDDDLGIQMISIVGSGGIGKTTLAQYVYNDDDVMGCFKFRVWICVSSTYDWKEIAIEIVNIAGGSIPPGTKQLDTLLWCLTESIQGKKFLLILDDVWENDLVKKYTEWDALKSCLLKEAGVGSKVLVTTRNAEVAKRMGTKEKEMHRLGLLSPEDCRLLFNRIAHSDRSPNECAKFEEVGKRIADKCKGLPLAAKALGGMLGFKNSLEEWEDVAKSDIWELELEFGSDSEKPEINIFPHLLLTYNELSPALRRCFSYCAMFPKDHLIHVDSLVRHWIALGYLGSSGSTTELELIGRKYFNILAMHSLFQDFVSDKYNEHVVVRCKMHDIVHDFALFLKKDTRNGRDMQATCQICNDPSLVSHVKQYHSWYFEAESTPYVCDCLVSVRLLSLVKCGPRSIPKGMETLIHLRYLDLGGNNKLTTENLKIVFKLYNLKSLILSNCNLQEIPSEIKKLFGLRHLELSYNRHLKELPNSICDLDELQSLNIEGCASLSKLPQGIEKLRNLYIQGAFSKGGKFPDQAIGQLSNLCTLTEFKGRLSYLKELNKLSGSLDLTIPVISGDQDIVKEAEGAELVNKVHLRRLKIEFLLSEDVAEEVSEEVSVKVLDALQPHQSLYHLQIKKYTGSKLPDWITGKDLNSIVLNSFHNLTLLPPLGKLPFLEQLEVIKFRNLEFVGRDLLGITKDSTSGDTASSSSSTMGFPKLKILVFDQCPNWRQWEDITVEEASNTSLVLFPCLKELRVIRCPEMSVLPERLLKKASKLGKPDLIPSPELEEHLDKSKDGSDWEFISHIPLVTFD